VTRADAARPVTGYGTEPTRSERGAGCPAEVERRIWEALRYVEDPEIPVSVLGMGLIVSVAYDEAGRRADLRITYTAMGCPAMDFIQDDIREALLADPEIDSVDIEVVWDPVWTKDRIRSEARETMRELGIAV
jgi:metal-sulfur cluster biosynthetic enzyme